MNPVRATESIDISVVVPTYKGARSLDDLVRRTEAFLAERTLRGEIILVNDSSPDDTWSVIERLTRAHQSVVGIDLMTNEGQALATLCGIAHARGRFVATMDDDLQQWPEDLGKLLDALDEHPDWDAAIGSWDRDHNTLSKRFGSWMHARVDHYVHGTPRGFRHTSFRLMRRPLADALVEHQTRTPVLSPMVRQLSSQVYNVEVRHSAREHGGSTITLRESVRRVITNVVHGTTLPLRLLSRLGAAAAALSVILTVFFVARWAVGIQTPPGWASELLLILFFGGMSLLGIGIIGRYLGVIVEETRGRPKWGVRRVLDSRRVAELPYDEGDPDAAEAETA
jgi:dolichol-phosphate mannosyltransferase/undecaprenyl-phosphate 4-deoxy-4-formamido-L-arabinose transferase